MWHPVFYLLVSTHDVQFVCFILTNNYKNKAIQRRGVEVNGAMALQPVEAPGRVCQQTAKIRKEYIFSTNQAGVALEHA